MTAVVTEIGYRVLALAAAWLSFVMIAWSVWRLRRPQPLRLITPLVAITGAVASLAVYVIVSGISIRPLAFVALLIAGAAVGLGALALIRVDVVATRMVVRRSHWFLLLWAASLIALQAASALDSPNSFAAGMAATVLSVGLMGSLNVGLLARRLRGVAA